MATTIGHQRLSHQRLAQQRLTQNQFAQPEEIVAWMGAMQAQEYEPSKWAINLRLTGATDASLEEAFNAGRILRTHVMRPTWHFVAPADIRWILELTGPRVFAGIRSYYRQLGLDEAILRRSNEVIAQALAGGRFLTRAELGKILATAGIATEDLRLSFLMSRAELDAVICSGPRRGKQFTYALLAERAPQAKSLPREEALAELTLRYFTSHAPATIHDFAWWSGLTLADIKEGLALAGSQLASEEIDGQVYWFPLSMQPAVVVPEATFLLPTYDEFLIGYNSFDQMRQMEGKLNYNSTIVNGGKVIGSWKRTIQKKAIQIELAPFVPPAREQAEAIEAAAQRYGEFVGLPVTSTFVN
jgi:hypothetical protein